MFTHAHGISGHDERRDSLASALPVLEMHSASINRESMNPSSMGYSHCHEQVDAASDDSDRRTMDMDTVNMDGMDMDEMMDMPDPSMAMPIDEAAHAQHTTHQSDCCQSLLCKCPCAHAVAMYFSLPYVPALKPRSLTIIAGAAPVLHAGLSGQFRPPI